MTHGTARRRVRSGTIAGRGRRIDGRRRADDDATRRDTQDGRCAQHGRAARLAGPGRARRGDRRAAAAQPLPAAGERRGRQSAVLVLFGEGDARPRAAAHGAGRARCARTPASPPSPAAPSTRRTATRTATGRCGPRCARPRRRPGSTRPASSSSACCPSSTSRSAASSSRPVLGWWREPSPVGVVDPAETARVFTVPVADLTDPGQPRDDRPPQRPPRPGIPGRIGPGLGLHGRSDRPDPALRGLGAALGPREAGPARLARMTG